MATNEWYNFYLRTGGNLHVIPYNDYFIKEIIRRDNIREGRPEGTPLTEGRIRHWAYRFDEERPRWGTDFDSVMPIKEPEPEPLPPLKFARSNFLNMGDSDAHEFAFTFMCPAWYEQDRPRFDRFIAAYINQGNNSLYFSPWAYYRGQRYDYRQRLNYLGEIIDHLISRGIHTWLFLHTDAMPGRSGLTYNETVDNLDHYMEGLPQVKLWCSGWEFPQIDQNQGLWWAWNGETHTKYIAQIKARAKQGDRIAVHFTDERTAFRPHYRHPDPGWEDKEHESLIIAKEAGLDILLYQRHGNESLDKTFLHTFDEPNPYGTTGDCGRVIAAGLKFIPFELSQSDPVRWRTIRDKTIQDGRSMGYG